MEHAKATALEGAGEVKTEMVKAAPEVRMKKWNGEVDLGIKYANITATGAQKGNVMEWKGSKEELRTYVLEPGEGMEDGGLEIELVLKEKPANNVFEFQLEGTEDLDFFYQAPMNERPECATGSTETLCLDEEGNETGSMPENVVGSYAIYHKTNANYEIGSTNYATGKVGHIYRPKIVDADGTETWGTLNHENGVLWVTVPQEFLNNATYPVIVDPTVGYTTIGSFCPIVANFFNKSATKRGNTVTVSATSTLASGSAGVYYNGATTSEMWFGIYEEDSAGSGSHDLITSMEGSVTFPDPAGFEVVYATTTPEIVPGDYILSVVANASDPDINLGRVSLCRDGGQPSTNNYNEGDTEPSAYTKAKNEDPWTETASATTSVYSLYFTTEPQPPDAPTTTIETFETAPGDWTNGGGR